MNTLAVLAATLPIMMVQIDESDNEPLTEDDSKGRRTLGGTQFWTDYLVCHGWRIQRNVYFGHFRLLKPNNRVLITGGYKKCIDGFHQISQQKDFPLIKPKVVVTLHGLGRSRSSMQDIGQFLESNSDFTWINVGYASTRNQVAQHARALRSVIEKLARIAKRQNPNVKLEINFVAHSLGNIVVRHFLHDVRQLPLDKKNWKPVRFVMLAPPNQGSAMASLLKKYKAFQLIAGASGKNLSTDWTELEKKLAVPDFQFAIIAGGKGDESGYNPVLDGDDDLIVSVKETRLAGAHDFMVVPAVHTYIMDKQQVKDATLKFLQHGFLKSENERQPILKVQDND